MPAFYVAPEYSTIYTINAPAPSTGRAVLNDPTDPDFVGWLDGDEAITGIDSPDIRDSYADYADRDGGMAGSSFYTRRAIVLNGKVIPTSVSDRNTKIGKLMAATDARFADGFINWVPAGGERVYLAFRRQLPLRVKGGFNKDFQIGLVCAEPRILTSRRITQYTETNGNTVTRDYRRFTWASGSGVALASRDLFLPPGDWILTIPIKRSTTAGTLRIDASNSTGANTPANLTTGWTDAVQARVTANAANVATVITLTLSAALTAGQWVEVGDIRASSVIGLAPADNANIATNWTGGAGYTASFETAAPPPAYIRQPGSVTAPTRVRAIGPFSNAFFAPAADNQVQLQPSAAYTGAEYAVIDFNLRTVLKNATTNDYAANQVGNSTWGGVPAESNADGFILAFGGAGTSTRMETTWRGAWL